MAKATDELYRNEAYKLGSKEKELEEFQRHVQRVLAAQQRLAAQHFSGQRHRVFHAKSHGCLTGKLNLLESRPQSTQHGIFGSNGKTSYDVLARFSNGVGSDGHDLKPDVRGIGLKIFGVTDRSTDADGQRPRTIDFLMTNSTNAFGRDQEEFVEFMEASVNPGPFKIKLLRYLFTHRKVACLLFKATSRIVSSLTTQRYWSGHAYLLGQDRAMKVNVRPGGDPENKKGTMGCSKVNRNYLSIDLLNRARRGPIKFIFSVQLEKNETSTPIEDGRVEWKESDSPSIPVAELVLDQQDKWHDCENLSFTPGHHITAHRPLGNIGRGRVFTYEASQKGRDAALADPDESMVFGKQL